MAFAQIGAAGALIQAASLQPTGAYAGPNADAWFVDRVNGGGRAYQPSRLNKIIVSGARLLEPAAAAAPDPANDDTGRLVTAAAGANEHGLPSNFGRGRGHWRDGDEERVRVLIMPQDDAKTGVASTAGDISPFVYPVAHSVRAVFDGNGDISIDVQNKVAAVGPAAGGEGDLLDFDMVVEYLPERI